MTDDRTGYGPAANRLRGEGPATPPVAVGFQRPYFLLLPATGENRFDGKAESRTAGMKYHPEKLAQSSAWFHRDEWLDFNSIQEWPENQVPNLVNDYPLTPAKPTCLLEGWYEKYHRFNPRTRI